MKILDWIINWKNKGKYDLALQELDNDLKSALVPLKPNPQFTNNLRQNLLRQITEVKVITSPAHQKLQTGLIVTGGVLGGVFVFITSIRGFISILGLTGLIINRYKDNMGGSLSTTEC